MRSREENDELTRSAMARALARWPELAARAVEFATFARAHRDHDLVNRGHELYLTFACSIGDRAAIRILEREYLTRAIRVMARVNQSPEFIEDGGQVLRERLLVGPGARIGQFAGSGPLGAWLRVAALRTALNLHKARRDEHALTAEMLDLPAPDGADGERYREVAQAAIDAALTVLSPRERNVLRLSYLEAASIDRIAALYGTHRATAARWLAAAREHILEHVAETLRLKLGLTPSEIRSVILRIRSRLHISIVRLLQGTLEEEPAS